MVTTSKEVEEDNRGEKGNAAGGKNAPYKSVFVSKAIILCLHDTPFCDVHLLFVKC